MRASLRPMVPKRGALTCRSGAGRRPRRRFSGRSERREEGVAVPIRWIRSQCGRGDRPSVRPNRPVRRSSRRKRSAFTCRSDQWAPSIGIPQRYAVRLLASSGVSPSDVSDRKVRRVAGATPARRVFGRGDVEAEPDATPEGGVGATQDEARRDGRPCPRDPRCAWPAMSQRNPHSGVVCACLRRSGRGRDDPAVRGSPVLAAARAARAATAPSDR